MTPLRKAVYRVSATTIRECGRARQIIVGLCPGDVLELRLKGTRRRYLLGISSAFYQAVRLKGEQDKREREARRKARRSAR